MTCYYGKGMMAGVGVYVASRFSGSSPRGALHLGFSRLGSDVVVMMETVDARGLTGLTCVVLVRSTLQG